MKTYQIYQKGIDIYTKTGYYTVEGYKKAGESMREYLKKMRNAKNVSQKETAEALGISQNYYSCIENGQKQKNIDLKIMIGLSDFFSVDLQQLIDKEIEYSNTRNKGA